MARPKLPEFQCGVFGGDPVAEPRGRRSIIISGRRDRPSSIVRPQPNFAKTESAPNRI